ncbi:MAG: hypothetical protein ACREJX_00710 [Polyangiaceae bacterium]
MTFVVVTDHALARARQRYGLVNIDIDLVVADVRSALLAGRGSRFHPNGTGYECTDGGIYVWTKCRQRLYVVGSDRRRRRPRLIVLTALRGFYGGDHMPDYMRAGCMTPERAEAIVRLLQTRDEHLPEPIRRSEASSGFVHRTKAAISCPDCLANGRVLKTCETCHGQGFTEEFRERDPYAIGLVLPFGFDVSRHDETHDRDRQIEMLERQTEPPKSEEDMLADANAHPYVWELARRRMYRLFDYPVLDRALELLRDVDHSAYRALHAVYVYGWAPPGVGVRECDRGLAFLDERLPDPLRAPAPERQRAIVGKLARAAGPSAHAIRDDRIRELAASNMKPAEIAAACFVSIRTVYNVVREAA